MPSNECSNVSCKSPAEFWNDAGLQSCSDCLERLAPRYQEGWKDINTGIAYLDFVAGRVEDDELPERIELARKDTWIGTTKIGLFYRPRAKEFVTWLIIDGDTYSGHYFNDIHDALEDFDKRE